MRFEEEKILRSNPPLAQQSRTMKTIWKFDIPLQDEFTLQMPVGSKLLTIQLQHDHPKLWAVVEPNATVEYRVFRTVGTGNVLPEQNTARYIGTYQIYHGDLVFHVFEINLPLP